MYALVSLSLCLSGVPLPPAAPPRAGVPELFPHEDECREAYYRCCLHLQEIERLAELVGNTWPLRCQRRDWEWQRRYWWACWYVTWREINLPDRIRWLAEVDAILAEQGLPGWTGR